MNLTMRLSSHYNHFPKPDGFYFLDFFFWGGGWGGGGGVEGGVCVCAHVWKMDAVAQSDNR